MKFAIALFVLLTGGCALTSAAPGGPLRSGAYTQVQPSWAIAYGPASMKVDGVRVSKTAQSRNVGGGGIDPFPNPIPLAVGVRQAVGRNVEVSGDVGWVDSGVGLRVALPLIPHAEPLVLSGGIRTGRVSFFRDESYEARGAIEAYPAIAGSGTRSLRLMLSAGLAAGTFSHELLLPDAYRSDSDAPTGPPRARILRPEIRLQTSVGLFVSREHGCLGVALSPWVLIDADQATASFCQDCDAQHTITNYAQTWGASLTVATSLGSDFTR